MFHDPESQQRPKNPRPVHARRVPAMLGVVGTIAAALLAARTGSSEEREVRVVGPFDDAALRAAASYLSFDLVNDHPHWAPTRCIGPKPRPFLSASTDADTHGRKLYFLFTKDISAYADWDRNDQPPGQILVKEGWKPVLVDESVPGVDEDLDRDAGTSSRRKKTMTASDGKQYRVGDRADLFMMIKTDPATPGTDAGWVYAVVSPDGKTVQQAGVIESCQGCHERATHDRILGGPAPVWMPEQGSHIEK